MQEEFSDFIRFLANRAYRLISICPVALNILFDLIQSSGADALEDELRSQASACLTRIPPTYGGPLLMKIKRDTGMRLFFLTSLCMYQTYPYGGIIRIRLWVEAFSLLSAG
mgnify:CR=1 FL=1